MKNNIRTRIMKSNYDSDFMYRTGKYTYTGKLMIRYLKRKANKVLNEIYPTSIDE